MKRLVVLTVLAIAGTARGQTLPAPQFATPAANDSSSRAATTAWVKSLNFLSATGDLSQATARAAGATAPRTLAARAADVFNVLDYGAVADGVTDIGPALAAIAARLGSGASSNVIYFPAGSYRLATPVTFNGVAPILQGQGFAQGPFQTGWTGTWIKVDTAGVTPVTFSGTNARGAKVRDLAFYEVHPAPAAGWAPNANDYVFKALNALGEITFDNVLFAGVNKGIYADNSGRLAIKDVQGQFYTAGIEIDDCYDIPRIDRLHSWTFATSSPFVVSYQEAHADTVLLRRVDGIFIGDLFTLGMYSAIHFSSGTNGVTTKAYVDNLYADFVNYGILVDGAGSDFQVANMTTQNNDQTNSGTTLPNGYGVWINTTGVSAQIGNLYSKLTAGPAVEVDGNSNRVNIANLRANTYGTPGAGTPAVNVSDSGTNASNQVYVGNKEQLQGTAPLVLFNSTGNGGRERFVMMNDVGGANQNEVRAYSAVPGNAPQLAAIGGDSNIDLYVNGKGTSGVRLQSSGQTVLRADNPNGSTNDFLLRGGTGTMNWIAEGGDSNIDVYLTPKGTTGGVRLQGAGATVLRVDNPNASVDDLLVRGGAASLNLLPEGAEAAIDLYLSAKGAGSVRMQANGATVLRADNPNLGTSDLLVRPGPATMALTVEDPAANANLVLNPKGAGLVSTANCPAQTDNSNNLACTNWVKTWVLAQGYGAASSGGITALTGDVTASGTGSVAASLASVGTAGTYGKVTTDAKGRVVAGATLAAADVTGALGYTPLPSVAPSAAGTLTVSGVNSLALSGAPSLSGPTIAAVGGDPQVDLNLTSLGAGSVRIKSNGVNVIRTDSPGPGTSDILFRSGNGTVSMTLEDSGSNASLTINPKGSGTVNVPTAATSSNGVTAASTAFVRSVLPCVQPQSGRAYAPPNGTPATVALPNTSSVQAIYAVPLIVCGSKPVTALAFEITTPVSSGFSARMAIYADSLGQPSGAPLADTGAMTIAANATGVRIGAISSGPTLQPGVYWLTFQSSYLASPATVRALNAGDAAGVSQALGYSLTAGAASTFATCVYQNGSFGAPPNPFGTVTGYATANTPLVWVVF